MVGTDGAVQPAADPVNNDAAMIHTVQSGRKLEEHETSLILKLKNAEALRALGLALITALPSIIMAIKLAIT